MYAGTVAIESMGGPVLGFCAGRVDDADGSASVLLGPTSEQAATEPCPVNGQCQVCAPSSPCTSTVRLRAVRCGGVPPSVPPSVPHSVPLPCVRLPPSVPLPCVWFPCFVRLQLPLGTTTVGLIYVNPGAGTGE